MMKMIYDHDQNRIICPTFGFFAAIVGTAQVPRQQSEPCAHRILCTKKKQTRNKALKTEKLTCF